MMEFYAVVVLYNKKIQDSITVRCLLETIDDKFHIIVLDNSEEKYVEENENSYNDSQIEYYKMDGNIGLSKAYNYVLSLLKEKNGNDIVIWFDDDTSVRREYFECLKKFSKDLLYDVFVPIIYGQDGVIYSPNKVGFLKGKYIKTPEQTIPENKFNAINSCLAVRLRAYQGYRYDEGLFMDCVDTKLFDDFRKRKMHFCVLPVKIEQNFFQRNSERNLQKYISRFKIRIKDTLYYSKLNGIKGRVSGYIRIVGWSIVYGIKLRSFKFGFMCIYQMLTS